MAALPIAPGSVNTGVRCETSPMAIQKALGSVPLLFRLPSCLMGAYSAALLAAVR